MELQGRIRIRNKVIKGMGKVTSVSKKIDGLAMLQGENRKILRDL